MAGIGTFLLSPDEAEASCLSALGCGYRLIDIVSFTKIPPMVNQVETHVLNQQTEARQWMDKYQVQAEAWAPFGEGRGGLFENPVLAGFGGDVTAQPSTIWPMNWGWSLRSQTGEATSGPISETDARKWNP